MEQFWLAATCVENIRSYHFPPVHHLPPTHPHTHPPSPAPPLCMRKENFDGVLSYFYSCRTGQNQWVLRHLGYTCIFNNLIKITEIYLPLNHYPKMAMLLEFLSFCVVVCVCIHFWYVLFWQQAFNLLFVNCCAPIKPEHLVYQPVGKPKVKGPGNSRTLMVGI